MNKLATFVIIQLTDLMQTHYGLSIGMSELNPLINYFGFWILIFLKIVLIAIFYKFKKIQKILFCVSMFVIIANTFTITFYMLT